MHPALVLTAPPVPATALDAAPLLWGAAAIGLIVAVALVAESARGRRTAHQPPDRPAEHAAEHAADHLDADVDRYAHGNRRA